MQMPWEKQSIHVAPKMNIGLVRGQRGKKYNGKKKERQQQKYIYLCGGKYIV